jgi:NADH dehydrogenase [ubiquinone] 1 alpha subcomplex assembly factor 7
VAGHPVAAGRAILTDMNRPVLDSLASTIHADGPVTFDAFMEICLYGPGGFYERPPVGSEGDFVTSPHVHPLFGALVADAIDELPIVADDRTPFHLVDVGAGDGMLLRHVIANLDDRRSEVTAIDRSPGAREALETIEGVAVLGDLESGVSRGVFATGPGVVIAHELLDNLPFRRVRGTLEGPREVRIGLDDDRPIEVLAPLDDELEGFVERNDGLGATELTDGEEIVVPIGAIGFVETVAAAISGSDATSGEWYVLVVDYGTDRGSAGEVHGYRGHRVVDDILAAPGSTDITAGVAFGVVERAFERGGMATFATVSQRQALLALGFEAWLHSALERQGDLLNTGRGPEAVRAWGGRTRAMMLVDPAGLGRFRWFVAATQGLPEPAWLARARATP